MLDHNLFKLAEHETMAVSLPIFDRLLSTKGVKPSTVVLYLALVRHALNGPTMRILTKTLLDGSGLSRPVFTAQREFLVEHEFIECHETKKAGVWQYEVLGLNGATLPTYESFVVFKELPDEAITAYYSDRIGTKVQGIDASGRPLFNCPFHQKATTRNLPTLKINLNRNEEDHGTFNCNECETYGGMIWFETSLQKKRGRIVTRDQAARSVRNFMIAAVKPKPDYTEEELAIIDAQDDINVYGEAAI